MADEVKASQAGAVRKTYTTFMEKASYGLYFVGQNLFYLFISSYLMLFYTDYRGMSAGVVGTIFLVARVWDAVNDPLFGIIIDKTNLKWGKFKPWISISTVLIPIATILIFVLPEDMDTGGKIVYASVTYILWGMLYTICDVPIFSLVTAMTDNIKERTLLISIGRTCAMVAMLALSILMMPIILELGWLTAAIAMSIVGFIVMFPINIWAKERFNTSGEAVSLRQIFKYVAGNKYMLIFYGGVIVLNSGGLFMTTGNYVAKYMLGGEEMIAPAMIVMVIPMVIIAPLVPVLNRKFDKFQLFLAGIFSMVVFAFLGHFFGYASPENLPMFFTFAAMRGIGFGFMMVVVFMVVADTTEYGQYKTGERATAVSFSIQTFTTKLTGALAAFFGAMVMEVAGYDGTLETQSAGAIDAIWYTYYLIPAIAAAISIPIFLQYKLKDKDVQIMANFNAGEITREEADAQLSRKY